MAKIPTNPNAGKYVKTENPNKIKNPNIDDLKKNLPDNADAKTGRNKNA